MIPFSLSDIAHVLNAKWVGKNNIILSVTTDSKAIINNKKCLFVMLKGKRFDAHDFADLAVNDGVSALLVNRQLPFDVPQLIVSDTNLALRKLTSWIRQQVSARIIALTGSTGKTSVKDMTFSILRQRGHVLATQGNLNNDLGVSLTLLRLTPEHDYAVIELGANHLDEIALATNLVQPEIALVNNLSAAHLAGFGSMLGVAKAKGEIFTGLPAGGLGIFNADSHDWNHWQEILKHKSVWRFAIQGKAGVDFFASDIVSYQHGMSFTLHSPQGEYHIQLPLRGRYNIANALAASALALSVGADLPEVAAGLAQMQPLPGRMFPITLSKGQLLLDDSYNSNVGSMIAVSQSLMEMPGYRVMVVGDMAELGDEEVKYHRQVGEVIAMTNIDKVLSVGNLSCFISEASGRGEHFQDKFSLISRLIQLLSDHVVITILVKGSRIAAMEQVVEVLQGRVLC